jgi:hypothetical protein
MRDGATQKQIKRAISPYYYNDNTAWVGEIVDHQGYDAATYLLSIGAVVDADATFAVLLQESDNADFSSATNVADEDMVSQTRGTAAETAAAFIFSDDNEVRKLGYIGNKRYTRLYVTGTNNTGYTLISAVCVLEQQNPANTPITPAAS